MDRRRKEKRREEGRSQQGRNEEVDGGRDDCEFVEDFRIGKRAGGAGYGRWERRVRKKDREQDSL